MANVADLQAGGMLKYTSQALENGAQVATAQCILFGFDGRNTDSGAACYIMVFNKATAPVSGTDVPVIAFGVPAAGVDGSGNFFYNEVTYGEMFTKGIYILASSTDFNGSTFNILASNKIKFHVQYALENGA